MTEKAIPNIHLGLYSLPALPLVMLVLPTFSILPAFYAKYTSLSLETVGAVVLIARILDAITDPLIGFLSERTQSRLGKRKPWMIAGALIGMVSAYFLFSPTPDVGVFYFLVWSSMLYIGWTMIDIPYNAWGAEISGDYNERTRIVTVRMILGSLGSLLFFSAPLLPFFSGEGFTPDVIATVGVFIAVALPVCIMLPIVKVPASMPSGNEEKVTLRHFRDLLRNRIFLRFVTAFSFTSLAGGVYNGLLYLYIDDFLRIGDKYSYVAIVVFLVSWLSLPGWMYIMKHVGKHKGWVLGAICATAVTPALALVPPGPSGFPFLLIIVSFISFGWAANMVAPYSIMADIIDYDELRSGVNQASNYFAVFSLLTKLCIAIGSGLGFILIGFAGYEVAIANDLSAQRGFLLVMLGLPLVFNLVMITLLWNFPLGHKRQKIIRKRLVIRSKRRA